MAFLVHLGPKNFSPENLALLHTTFFFYLGFLSRTFTNHKTAGEDRKAGLSSYTHKSFAFLHTTWNGFLAPCQKLKKANDTIPIKHPKRPNDERNDRQTIFYWTFPATAQGPTRNGSTTFLMGKLWFTWNNWK